MRPYIEGEALVDVSIAKGDTIEVGGMIAYNPDVPSDRWYVSKAFFEKNYEEA